jgi:hypothetical protein
MLMLAIDVGNMSRQWIELVEPGRITRSGQLQKPAVNGIKLIVVVRDDRSGPVIEGCFVIGLEFAEVPPAVLINRVAFSGQRVLAFGSFVEQCRQSRMRVDRSRAKVRDRLRFEMPISRRADSHRLMSPVEHLQLRIFLTERQPDRLRLLLTTLQLQPITSRRAKCECILVMQKTSRQIQSAAHRNVTRRLRQLTGHNQRSERLSISMLPAVRIQKWCADFVHDAFLKPVRVQL